MTDSSNPFQSPRPADDGARADAGSDYGRNFWFTYVSNAAMMAAVSLLYRYADFVHAIGGDEWHLGWIVGLGMIGSLTMRLFQGTGIDRYGSKRIWLWSSVGVVAALLGHGFVTRVGGPEIFLLRIVYQTSVSGVFGASITYISRRAPLARTAEIVGTLGTSGFIGMMAGATLGDWLCPVVHPPREQVDRLFLVAGGLSALSLLFAVLATRGHVRAVMRTSPPMWALLKKYNPGWMLLMGVATGFGVNLPTYFLRPFLNERNIAHWSTFFWCYTIVAFAVRVSIRRVPEKFGIRPMMLCGISFLAASMPLYLLVTRERDLMMPAILLAAAHALLFPAIVAGGSTAFPTRFRGLGTTLMLSTVDLGSLLCGPTVGGVLELCRRFGWPAYPVMFSAVAALLTFVLALYYVVSRRDILSGRTTRILGRDRTVAVET